MHGFIDKLYGRDSKTLHHLEQSNCSKLNSTSNIQTCGGTVGELGANQASVYTSTPLVLPGTLGWRVLKFCPCKFMIPTRVVGTFKVRFWPSTSKHASRCAMKPIVIRYDTFPPLMHLYQLGEMNKSAEPTSCFLQVTYTYQLHQLIDLHRGLLGWPLSFFTINLGSRWCIPCICCLQKSSARLFDVCSVVLSTSDLFPTSESSTPLLWTCGILKFSYEQTYSTTLS